MGCSRECGAGHQTACMHCQQFPATSSAPPEVGAGHGHGAGSGSGGGGGGGSGRGRGAPCCKSAAQLRPGRPILHLTSGRADRMRHEQRGECQRSPGSSPAASAHPVCFQQPIPTRGGRARAVQGHSKGPVAGALRHASARADAHKPLDVSEPCSGIRAGLTIHAVVSVGAGETLSCGACWVDVHEGPISHATCAMSLQSDKPPVCGMH